MTGRLPPCRVVAPLPLSISIEELTAFLHRAHADLAARGHRYLATHQDAATTRRRIGGGDCLVATLDGRLVGTVTFKPGEKAGGCDWYEQSNVSRCEQLPSLPSLRGRWLGSLLMDLVEERA